MKLLLKLACVSATMLLCSTHVRAEDGDGSKLPIDQGPIGGGGKPKVPSKYRVNCYVDADELVIECNADVVGEIEISDALTLKSIYHNFVPLFPEYRCSLYGLAGAMTDSGHAFIADGTKNIKYQIIRYQLEDDVYVSSFLKNEVTELIHYNWGWGGSCNGWFNLKAVDPSSAAEYDNPSEFNYSGYIFDKNSIISWYYKI